MGTMASIDLRPVCTGCETCKGNGQIKLEMNFLPTSYVPCEDS